MKQKEWKRLQCSNVIIEDASNNANANQLFVNEADNQLIRFEGVKVLYQGLGFVNGAELKPGSSSWNDIPGKNQKRKNFN